MNQVLAPPPRSRTPSLILMGTDTGVGKTALATGLLRLAHQRGLAIAPYKPVESGVTETTSSDAARLLRASRLSDLRIDEVSPYRLALPLAPSIAARLESRTVSLPRLTSDARRLLADRQALLIETAGGLLSPYGPGINAITLAHALRQSFPVDVLLIAPNQLGAINHCSLAALALRHHSMPCLGVVLVDRTDEMSLARAFNPAEIEAATDLPVLGCVAFFGAFARHQRHSPGADEGSRSQDTDPTADDEKTFAAALAKQLDLSTIFGGAFQGA